MNWDWAFWIGGVVVGVGALVLLAWAMLGDRSRGRRRCPRCWYDMSVVPGLVCPECGREAGRERGLFRTRRRWRWAAAASVLGVSALGLALTPRVLHQGWSSVVPIRVLMLALPLFDAEAEATVKGGPGAAYIALQGGGSDRWGRLLVAHGLARVLDSREGMARNDMSGLSLLLRDLGPEVEPCIPSVLRLLRYRDPRVRMSAVRALGGVESRRIVVVRALGRHLADPDASVAHASAESIGRLCAAAQWCPPEVAREIENRGLEGEFVRGLLITLAGRNDQVMMRRLLAERWWVWRLAGIRLCEHWSRYGGPLESETLAVLHRLADGDPRDEVRLRAREVLEEAAGRRG